MEVGDIAGAIWMPKMGRSTRWTSRLQCPRARVTWRKGGGKHRIQRILVENGRVHGVAIEEAARFAPRQS